ncbi:MAG: lytic transglycosylase domain-containing protein [Treponema sp.]|nr:lytic transglycosylase domain-containing protein [Treponema sp.]
MNDSKTEKIKLFESALASPNEYIRRAAAEELAVLMIQGTELSAKTAELVRREVRGWWAAAFDITPPDRDKALSFLLGVESNTASFDLARSYVLNECEKNGLTFTDQENAAIEGHNAVFHLRYNDALGFFRIFQEDGKWPDKIPDLFFEYPMLINDLGRTFQFTATGGEGLNLFLKWETGLSDQFDDMRFRLIFYAARIARRMGASQNANAISLFERALVLAPDFEQQDACIWYILDASISGSTAVFYDRLERHVPKWYSASYYNGLMERYLVRLVTGREWRRVIRTFNLIKDTEAVIPKAGFAWVIARTMEENFLNAEDRRLAAQVLNVSSVTPAHFYQIAYDAGESLLMPALYYRMQSAKALNLPLLVFSENNGNSGNESDLPAYSAALQFLLGFFANNAESLSVPYIRALERTLSPGELRVMAETLEIAEMYPMSMRMVSLYLYRQDHKKTRRDLELMYPRPFLELVEKNAGYFDIAAPLLFGLIRTESAFQSAVISRAGAVGLSQLMPGTAREQAERIRRAGGPDFFCSDEKIDSTNPDINVYIGSHYYNYLLSRFNNDAQLALMSYNGGQTRVRRWRNASNLPVDLFVETVSIYETRDYGRRVPAIGRIYEELYYREN